MTSQQFARRARMRATAAKRLLDRELQRAINERDLAQERLTTDFLAAVDLEIEARKKEIAAVLNPTDAQSAPTLTAATEALQAEIDRHKDGEARFKQIGDGVRLVKSALDLFG